MNPSSCMVGPLQGNAAQFINATPLYTRTTWQNQQSSGYRQPVAVFFSNENRPVANWQNWQSVTPTSGQQPNHFTNENQCNSSLYAHNGQSFVSNGSYPVRNFQPQSYEFNNSCPPNTTVYSKQDMSPLSTQTQTHAEKQPVSVKKRSFLEFYLSNQSKKVASNSTNSLDKPFPAQMTTTTTTTHPQGELKDCPSNRQVPNNRHDPQTMRQQGLSNCAQQPPNYLSAIQAKKNNLYGFEYGVWKHVFQPSNKNQTSALHQTRVSKAANVVENIPHLNRGHQSRVPGIDSHKSQTGSLNGSAYTGTMYINNNTMIPQRQSNHNTTLAALNAPWKHLDTPQTLPPCSGPASSKSNACNPLSTAENNNPSFDKKSFKAIAVVQPLEQEYCLQDASSCDAVDASFEKSPLDQQSKTFEASEDKSSSKFTGVQCSSVTTIPWTIETLSKLLEDNERAQQKGFMGLDKLQTFQPICTVTKSESAQRKQDLIRLMQNAAEFCRRYITQDSVILTELKGSYDENYSVLKHGELYSEAPYVSQWLNVGELDDIDKEFGFAMCLKNGVTKLTDQASEVTSIPAQIVKDDCVKEVKEIEPESTDPGIPNSPERRSSVEMSPDEETAPLDDSSDDSSDSEISFEINVLSPDQAKAIYEQIQKKTESDFTIETIPESDTGSKLSLGQDVTESGTSLVVTRTEYCCLARFFSTFLKKDSSVSNCLCESEKATQEKETDEIKKNTQPMDRSDSELLRELNQLVSLNENKQPCHSSDMVQSQKDKPCSQTPVLLDLLLHEKNDEDLCQYFAKIQANAKVSSTIAASDSKNTCSNSELKLKDSTSDSQEGTEVQSSLSKMPPLEDLPTEVKKGPSEVEHSNASKKCSNQDDDGKPPCITSPEVVVDLTDDEPVPSSESPSVGHQLHSQGEDADSSSDLEILMDTKADDIVLISDSEQTSDTASDSSAEPQSPASESATEGCLSPEMHTSSPLIDVISLSPKSPKVSVHFTERESLPLTKKVVKLRLFGSDGLQSMTVLKNPPKVLSLHLSPLKDSPSKATSLQDQSAKQRVYEKWKTSIVPVLTVGKRKDGTRKGSSILGVDRNRTAFVGNKPAESRICKRKQSEVIGVKLKRRKLSSAAKPVKWKGGSVPAAKDRDGAAVPLQENEGRRFRIPSTF